MTNNWTCPLCGRNKFTRKYQPHNCNHGFRKRGFEKMNKFVLLRELNNFNLNDEIKVYDTNGELLDIESVAEQVNDDDSYLSGRKQ